MEAGLSKWDEFWKGMDAVVAQRMDQIADIVMSEFPDAVPIFKYNMPGFKRNGNLIHFNAYRHHIGPTPLHSRQPHQHFPQRIDQQETIRKMDKSIERIPG